MSGIDGAIPASGSTTACPPAPPASASRPTRRDGSAVWALSRTERDRACADNGAARQPTATSSLACRPGKPFDVKLQSAIWPRVLSASPAPAADVDIALGATDTTPPSAPGTLTVTSGDTTAALSWGAAHRRHRRHGLLGLSLDRSAGGSRLHVAAGRRARHADGSTRAGPTPASPTARPITTWCVPRTPPPMSVRAPTPWTRLPRRRAPSRFARLAMVGRMGRQRDAQWHAEQRRRRARAVRR